MPVARARILCSLVVLFTPQDALSQENPPLLEAHSSRVDVRDGDRLLKGIWTIDPTIALDVYTALRSAQGKTITFITDIDSMSFDVQPGRTVDFTILLNGEHACRTRISTMTQSCRRVRPNPATGPDTIPIAIRGGKLVLQGKVNDSETLDLVFDTGADTLVLYPSALGKGATLRFDGTVNNAGTGGTTLRETSSDNRLEVAGLRWDHEPVLYVEKQADAADGIVGYRVFEDKIVEFDYDRMVLSIHDALPARASEFAKTAMPFSGSLTAVEAVLFHGEMEASGLFLLDTGGTGTMMVNQAFATGHGLHGAMEKLGTSSSRGVGSAAIQNEVVLLPELRLAGFGLPDVPIHLELPSDGNAAPPGGALCMEVLQRFNAILDYPRSEAYFRPNSRFGVPFELPSSVSRRPLILGIAAVIVALLAGWAFWKAKGMDRRLSRN